MQANRQVNSNFQYSPYCQLFTSHTQNKYYTPLDTLSFDQNQTERQKSHFTQSQNSPYLVLEEQDSQQFEVATSCSDNQDSKAACNNKLNLNMQKANLAISIKAKIKEKQLSALKNRALLQQEVGLPSKKRKLEQFQTYKNEILSNEIESQIENELVKRMILNIYNRQIESKNEETQKRVNFDHSLDCIDIIELDDNQPSNLRKSKIDKNSIIQSSKVNFTSFSSDTSSNNCSFPVNKNERRVTRKQIQSFESSFGYTQKVSEDVSQSYKMMKQSKQRFQIPGVKMIFDQLALKTVGYIGYKDQKAIVPEAPIIMQNTTKHQMLVQCLKMQLQKRKFIYID